MPRATYCIEVRLRNALLDAVVEQLRVCDAPGERKMGTRGVGCVGVGVGVGVCGGDIGWIRESVHWSCSERFGPVRILLARSVLRMSTSAHDARARRKQRGRRAGGND